MKYIVLLGDGMADYPVAELNGRTPLEAARTPNMDRMAGEGFLGLVDTIPAGLKPGSDVANLTVLGYDATEFYSGRGPLEAANMGVSLDADDMAFRCNLVCLGPGDDPVMEDFTAGHIQSSVAATIIETLQACLGDDAFRFYPGVGYRHLLVWHGGSDALLTTPPHDITGRPTHAFLPQGKGVSPLLRLMERARHLLRDHQANRERAECGQRPANAIWPWGQGRAPRMEKMTDRYGLRGGMISAVDLLNGIGVYAGLDVIPVAGATGYIDTDYAGKARAALASLRERDFVFVHVEAPDEMGHEGNLAGKIQAIEDFDEKVVGTVLQGIASLGDVRILVLSDHPTPIVLRTHAADPSPFAVWSSVPGENLGKGSSCTEAAARATGVLVRPGYRLMNLFLTHWREFVEEHQ